MNGKRRLFIILISHKGQGVVHTLRNEFLEYLPPPPSVKWKLMENVFPS